jgi:hypothetical protein
MICLNERQTIFDTGKMWEEECICHVDGRLTGNKKNLIVNNYI